MSLASRTSLHRPAADPEYLHHLHERALVRLEKEETAVGIVRPNLPSRRSALQRFGILLAGVVPGVAALMRAQTALAAGSVRSCAPQYGAPSWPLTENQMAPMVISGTAVRSRQELGKEKAWESVNVLVAAGGKGDWNGFTQAAARQGFYNDGWGGGTHRLVAVADPDADVAYILRGDQTFYAAAEGGMSAYQLQAGALSIHPCLFQRKGDTGEDRRGLAAVIADFAQVSDRAAYEKDRQAKTINLEKGLPQAFWIRNTDHGWVQSGLYPRRVERKGNILMLDVASNEYPSSATFTIDLKTQQLLKTSFEGKEWAP